MAKVIKIGSSLGVTVPKQLLKKMQLSLGSEVELRYNQRRNLLEIESLEVVDDPKVEHSFLGKVQLLSKRYAVKMKELEDEW